MHDTLARSARSLDTTAQFDPPHASGHARGRFRGPRGRARRPRYRHLGSNSGVTVLAHDDDELDRVQLSGIRPNQIVFRCRAGTDGIRSAVHRGVFRFIAGTTPQIARLTECAQRTKYVYLDNDAPAALCGRRVQVVGLHSEVDNSGDPDEWASATEKLLRRASVSTACESPVHRIVLSGGSTEQWTNCSVPYLTSVVLAVNAALREGAIDGTCHGLPSR